LEKYLKKLPGKEAHIRLAPQQRRADMFLSDFPPSDAKESAVLVLLLPSGETLMEWRVLIILRNSYNGVHSAQAAFPGGKKDDGDTSFQETALREAFEEMGIPREEITPMSFLSDLYVPPSNFLIHPLLAVAKKELTYQPNPREVVRYTTIPIHSIDPNLTTMKQFQSPTGEWLDAPGYEYDDLFIWGATAMILCELYQVTTDGSLAKLLGKSNL
jgi:8-oxo-dGTP pyrophosphatase MutT (NUDIX family)